jgi:hypothetical protein
MQVPRLMLVDLAEGDRTRKTPGLLIGEECPTATSLDLLVNGAAAKTHRAGTVRGLLICIVDETARQRRPTRATYQLTTDDLRRP